jgi:hypothetical protein
MVFEGDESFVVGLRSAEVEVFGAGRLRISNGSPQEQRDGS